MKFLKLVLISLFSIFLYQSIVFATPYIFLDLEYDGSIHRYGAEEVYIVVNDKQLTNLAMPPIIMNDRTLVPVREVFECLGAKVDWKESTREVNITYNDSIVILKIDFNNAIVNGKQTSMSVAPKIINDKTMIPLRFVSESLGLDVGWDSKTRIATIKENKVTTTTEITTRTTTEITTEATTKQVTQTTTKPTIQPTTEKPVIIQPTTTTTTTTTQNDNSNSSVNIPEMYYPKTYINSITIPESGYNNFIINASSEISKVDVSKLADNRLIIDVSNAENNVNQNSYTVSNTHVTQIRVAQNQFSPTMVTRIVFDLSGNPDYSVTLSPDRKNINVNFGGNNINNINLIKSGNTEIISILGDTAPSVKSFKLTNPDRIVIDLPYSNLNMRDGEFLGLNIVKTWRYSQYDSETVRIVLDVIDENVNYTISSSDNETIVTLKESAFRNLSYDSSNRRFIINKKAGQTLNINSVTHNDYYTDNRYELCFNGDYSSLVGEGQLDIDDKYLNNIVIETVNGITTMKISEKQILAYTLTEDANCIYIMVQLPKEKYKNIVVFDAGHGGHDNGASGNGLREKNLTLDMVNKILALFEKDDNIKAYSSRTTDMYPSFDDRTDLANEVGDAFISVHINSAGSNTSAKGTEVYHLNDNNTGSGLTSSILASTIQKNLVSYLGSTDRGVKTANFIVLRQSNVPAVLCEIGFITNYSEAANMGSDGYRQKVAQAIYDSVKYLFEKYPNVR